MRRSVAVVAGLTLLLGTLGTTTAAVAAPRPLPGMDAMMRQMEQDTAKLAGLKGKDFEVAFLQMMVPHHEAAVAMAQMVPDKATHAELKTLARTIIASQQQEVARMRGWLRDWYGVTEVPPMPMAGMDEMMAAMMQLTGADFEQAFLMMMPMHHQGAIMMAAQIPGRATHQELVQLGQAITRDQQREIGQMQGWARAWYGMEPMPMSHGGMPGMPSSGAGGAAYQPMWLATLAGLIGGGLLLGWSSRRRRHHQP